MDGIWRSQIADEVQACSTMKPMRYLHLPLKGEYFDQIKSGDKVMEYRIATPYWRKRLVGRTYDKIVLMRGYPKRDDTSRRIILPYQGYEVQTITHPHFGGNPVKVYAIHVSNKGAE